MKELMQTSNFRVTVVEEYDVVEICGALKVTFSTIFDFLAGRKGVEARDSFKNLRP